MEDIKIPTTVDEFIKAVYALNCRSCGKKLSAGIRTLTRTPNYDVMIWSSCGKCDSLLTTIVGSNGTVSSNADWIADVIAPLWKRTIRQSTHALFRKFDTSTVERKKAFDADEAKLTAAARKAAGLE